VGAAGSMVDDSDPVSSRVNSLGESARLVEGKAHNGEVSSKEELSSS